MQSEASRLASPAGMGTRQPLVTIVTPCFNSAAYIEQTLLSVANQTYPRVEHIVLDGGSTDGTVDIIKRHSASVARWISEPDHGQADAIRKGFGMARGDILAWLNADDVYLPDAIEAAVDVLAAGRADVVYGNKSLIDAAGRRIGERRLSPFMPYFARRGILYGGFGIYQPASFWTSELYHRVGGVDASFQFCMDNDLFVKFVLGGARFKFIRRELVQFRVHGTSKTSTIQDVARKDWARISAALPKRTMPYRVTIRLICRAWRLAYDLADTQGRYQWNRLRDKQYRFVP